MKRSLTDLEAYATMYRFLEKYYNQTGSDDVGSLLGSMQILEDKSTADPAMWDDWALLEKSFSTDLDWHR